MRLRQREFSLLRLYISQIKTSDVKTEKLSMFFTKTNSIKVIKNKNYKKNKRCGSIRPLYSLNKSSHFGD